MDAEVSEPAIAASVACEDGVTVFERLRDGSAFHARGGDSEGWLRVSPEDLSKELQEGLASLPAVNAAPLNPKVSPDLTLIVERDDPSQGEPCGQPGGIAETEISWDIANRGQGTGPLAIDYKLGNGTLGTIKLDRGLEQGESFNLVGDVVQTTEPVTQATVDPSDTVEETAEDNNTVRAGGGPIVRLRCGP